MNNKWVKWFVVLLYVIVGLTIVYIYWTFHQNYKGIINGVIIAFVIPVISMLATKFMVRRRKEKK